MHELPRVSLRHVGIFVTDFELMLDFEPFADWPVRTAKKMGLADFRITSSS